MDRRTGSFRLDLEFIEEYPETARAIMGRCIVIQCRWMYPYDTLEYLAISPYFDEVPLGKTAPRYIVNISNDGQCIRFERCD
jgi:hypothetical protein